jgi:hypothetical protein
MNVLRSLAACSIIFTLVLSACRTSDDESFNFDPAAHQRAVDLKSRAISLMANAGEAYSAHRADAEAIAAEMENASTLSAAAPNNAVIAAEWAAMRNPSGALYGGFVQRWQGAGRIDDATRDPWIAQVTVRFNYIICLEAAKKTKDGVCPPPADAAPGGDSASHVEAPPPT